MKETRKKALVVPDIHQNHDFLDGVFHSEDPDAFDQIIFLGDLFDSKEVGYVSTDSLQRCFKKLEWLFENVGHEKIHYLLGNHDAVYYFKWKNVENPSFPYKSCADYYGHPRVDEETLEAFFCFDDFWRSIRMVTMFDGYLISHAGFSTEHWSLKMSVHENINALNDRLDHPTDEHGNLLPVFRAGYARGGDLKTGGPLWMDWNKEFKDKLPFPQIVGHTIDRTWRKSGKSYCLDGRQSCYATIEDGVVHPKEL